MVEGRVECPSEMGARGLGMDQHRSQRCQLLRGSGSGGWRFEERPPKRPTDDFRPAPKVLVAISTCDTCPRSGRSSAVFLVGIGRTHRDKQGPALLLALSCMSAQARCAGPSRVAWAIMSSPRLSPMSNARRISMLAFLFWHCLSRVIVAFGPCVSAAMVCIECQRAFGARTHSWPSGGRSHGGVGGCVEGWSGTLPSPSWGEAPCVHVLGRSSEGALCRVQGMGGAETQHKGLARRSRRKKPRQWHENPHFEKRRRRRQFSQRSRIVTRRARRGDLGAANFESREARPCQSKSQRAHSRAWL